MKCIVVVMCIFLISCISVGENAAFVEGNLQEMGAAGLDCELKVKYESNGFQILLVKIKDKFTQSFTIPATLYVNHRILIMCNGVTNPVYDKVHSLGRNNNYINLSDGL